MNKSQSTKIKRNLTDIENEIINQIMVAETCFLICEMIPKMDSRGSDFLPFFFNLTFSKGVMNLHSLLLSKKRDEITIANYIAQKNLESTVSYDLSFDKKFTNMIEQMNLIFPISLRNKVIAHNDKKFSHTDFVSAYLVSTTTLDKYLAITKDLKDIFCEVANYDKNVSHEKIISQAKQAIVAILKS